MVEGRVLYCTVMRLLSKASDFYKCIFVMIVMLRNSTDVSLRAQRETQSGSEKRHMRERLAQRVVLLHRASLTNQMVLSWARIRGRL